MIMAQFRISRLLPSLVEPFFWNHMPNSTLGVGDISFSAGNKMDMRVEYGLPGGLADIHTDIEAGYRWIMLPDLSLDFPS